MIFIKEVSLVVVWLFKIGVIVGGKKSRFKVVSKIQCQNVLISFLSLSEMEMPKV